MLFRKINILFLLILLNCASSNKNTVISESPLLEKYNIKNGNYLFGRASSDISEDSSIVKARNDLLLNIISRINIYPVNSSLNIEEVDKKEAFKSIYNYLQEVDCIKEESQDKAGVYYRLLGVNMDCVLSGVEELIRNIDDKYLVTIENSGGQLIEVWITGIDIYEETGEIIGSFMGVNPSNSGYFQVDVKPCSEGGVVSIPGRIVAIEEIKEGHCSDEHKYRLHRILYR